MILSNTYQNKGLMTFCLIAISGIALAATGLITTFGITLNQTLAIIFSLVILTVWLHDKFNAVILGLIFFISKPFWVRFSFMIDFGHSGSGGFDLLGIMPAVLFAILIALQFYSNLALGKRICRDRTRSILMIFVALCFISIFFLSNSRYKLF